MFFHTVLIAFALFGQVQSACVDLTNPTTGVSDCASKVAYCNVAAYYSLMTTQCPLTCGRCTASSTTTTYGTCRSISDGD